MDHHCHVDVVEMAFGDQLGLAEQEFDLAALLPVQPLLDIYEFLSGDGEKQQITGEVFACADRRQSHRDAEHPGDLGIMAAAVRRPGLRVGERMIGGAQAVELTDEGEARARHYPFQPPLDARHCEAGLRLKTEGTHALGNERCGLDLVEASLGVMEDRLAELDNLVSMAIDRFAHRALQFVLACHRHPDSASIRGCVPFRAAARE
jgi:hypothetical protein